MPGDRAVEMLLDAVDRERRMLCGETYVRCTHVLRREAVVPAERRPPKPQPTSVPGSGARPNESEPDYMPFVIGCVVGVVGCEFLLIGAHYAGWL